MTALQQLSKYKLLFVPAWALLYLAQGRGVPALIGRLSECSPNARSKSRHVMLYASAGGYGLADAGKWILRKALLGAGDVCTLWQALAALRFYNSASRLCFAKAVHALFGC